MLTHLCKRVKTRAYSFFNGGFFFPSLRTSSLDIASTFVRSLQLLTTVEHGVACLGTVYVYGTFYNYCYVYVHATTFAVTRENSSIVPRLSSLSAHYGI